MDDSADAPREVHIQADRLQMLAEAIGVCALWAIDGEGRRLPVPLLSDDAAICAAKHAVEEACGVKIVMVHL